MGISFSEPQMPNMLRFSYFEENHYFEENGSASKEKVAYLRIRSMQLSLMAKDVLRDEGVIRQAILRRVNEDLDKFFKTLKSKKAKGGKNVKNRH